MIGHSKLVELVGRTGPFATLFLGPGDQGRERAQLAIDRVPIPAPHAGWLLDAVDQSSTITQMIVVDGAGRVEQFEIDDPVHHDLATYGAAPTVAPLIEAAQLTVSHVVITVEDDVYGLTTFGAVDLPASMAESVSVTESLNQTIEQLRAIAPRIIAIVGRDNEIDHVHRAVFEAFPTAVIHRHLNDDIDANLDQLADNLVRDAASMAAEDRTNRLAEFRAQRDAGNTLEGSDVFSALEAGKVEHLLVHPDVGAAVATEHRDRIDRAVALALAAGTEITMIPNVVESRGPAGDLGAILGGQGDREYRQSDQPVRART